MIPAEARGLRRDGLDPEFEAEEVRKSNLIMAGRMSRAMNQEDDAVVKFAEAAAIEERLAEICRDKGLGEEALVHHYSAAGCWAQASNFYRAIILCDDLLKRDDVSNRLRKHVDEYSKTLRRRRSEWLDKAARESALSED